MSSDTESRHARAHCRICGGPLAAMQSCGKCMWQAHQGWIAELDDAKAKDLSKTAWKQFLARADVQPGWVDYTLEWS